VRAALFARLADKYHLIARDYLDFVRRARPRDVFLHIWPLAGVMEGFAETLGLKRYSLFLQDCGGPISFRRAAQRTTRGALYPRPSKHLGNAG
jgi:hypothetical protein